MWGMSDPCAVIMSPTSASIARRVPSSVRHVLPGSPWRGRVEAFIRGVFNARYAAEVPAFAPNLMALERDGRLLAAAGWRSAAGQSLMLESYLDEPIECIVGRLAGAPVDRQRIVEVGNLAAERAGSSIEVIRCLARQLDALDFEWVVFTATSELIGIFRKLGLAPLAIAPADPERLGSQAQAWGRYYETRPVVVAGRIRLALEREARHG